MRTEILECLKIPMDTLTSLTHLQNKVGSGRMREMHSEPHAG